MSSQPCLFVYGTLKSGFHNRFARRLRREAKFLGPARMAGRLYRVRWYPGLRPARQTDEWVCGELYLLRHPDRILKILDAYEGRHEYRRELRRAILESSRVLTWVYVFRWPLPEDRRLPSGQFP